MTSLTKIFFQVQTRRLVTSYEPLTRPVVLGGPEKFLC